MTRSIGREEILEALGEVTRRAAAAGIEAKVHVLGGSAVALAIDDSRRLTGDVDSFIVASSEDKERLAAIAAEVAVERDLDADWLNTKAAMFIPDDGEPFGWRSLVSEGGFEISVAPADLLLAMKLRSRRGHRDTQDLDVLIEAAGLTTRAEVDSIFSRFFPRDEISPKSVDWLDNNGFEPAPIIDHSSSQAPSVSSTSSEGGRIYVDTHLRGGKWVEGHWRKRRGQ